MAKIFLYRGKVFSISDRNAFGEFVVVKFSADKKTVMDTRIIPAKNEAHAEKLIRTYDLKLFKPLPINPVNDGPIN